ncbi:MFS transporter [Pedobacter sp.]|uniref:MFS transporter n=1 Tax=Pedobacter sp. TaxID=1411316 RepID=UPI003D7FBC41
MDQSVPVIKPWVPEWLIRGIIFMVVLPSWLLFGLSVTNTAAAVGYYGFEPADVQYSVIVFFAALVSYYALERRFFEYLGPKEYFVVGTLIHFIAAFVCYHTHNLYVLLLFRFIQGMANCGITSICITLIFGRLRSERSREIGYSVYYGSMLCSAPFCLLLTAQLVDAYDYSVIYKAMMYFLLPGAIGLYLILNSVRLHKKIPLYQIDWASFVIYSSFLCLLGYVCVYGQQYYWLQDRRIQASVVALIALLILHYYRQSALKRPSHHMNAMWYRNFWVGLVLLSILYLIRGSLVFTTLYFGNSLGMDPIHISYIMIANICGIASGVLIASRLMLLKKSMRMILSNGFLILLVFHTWMIFLFSTEADMATFILPLLLQGLGVGLLMTPIIVFCISSVPKQIAVTAAATAVLFRFLGFVASTAMVNYYQLYNQANHVNRFQEDLSILNGAAIDRMETYKSLLLGKGIPADQATNMANKLFSKSVELQAQLRSAVDYYKLISILLVVVILVIAFFPYINRTIINVKSRQPAP